MYYAFHINHSRNIKKILVHFTIRGFNNMTCLSKDTRKHVMLYVICTIMNCRDVSCLPDHVECSRYKGKYENNFKYNANSGVL